MDKTCAVCGRAMRVILYSKKDYRGGHYFGKIPLCTKKALREAIKAGFRLIKFGKGFVRALKKDPKPYGYAEYWECPRCYWGR